MRQRNDVVNVARLYITCASAGVLPCTWDEASSTSEDLDSDGEEEEEAAVVKVSALLKGEGMQAKDAKMGGFWRAEVYPPTPKLRDEGKPA